jgi:hypothetical protein
MRHVSERIERAQPKCDIAALEKKYGFKLKVTAGAVFNNHRENGFDIILHYTLDM